MSDVASLKEAARLGRRSVMTYPHPSFDLSSAFIPPSMKELYRWCLYLYMTNSVIKPILKKKVAYVQTPLLYEGTDSAKAVWRQLLEDVINLKRVETGALMDANVYGVAYLSIFYPFERFLICPSCKEEFPLKNLDWTYEGYRWMSKCKCGHKGEFQAKSISVRNRQRVRIIRWRPFDMEIDVNPWTGYKKYVYRIPRFLKRKLEDPKRNKVLVETTPDELLEAAKENKNFELDADQVYVFEEISPSSEDEAFPIPPLLHIFKDSWLFQTLRRAQEAISVEHILPLTILIPSAVPGGVSPHTNYNLQTWADAMQDMIRLWRRDPNVIYTAPFPATVESVRGDARALDVFQDMEMVRQQMAAGLDVPLEFITGGLQWSGASVSLRVLENLFLNMIEDLERFEKTFLVPRLQRFLRLPPIKIRHQDFKMADDAQQKQIALSLRQTNTISDETVVEELGFTNENEKKRKREEREERLRQMREEQLEQAKVQADVMKIQAQAQMEIQQLQQAAAAAQQPAPSPESQNTNLPPTEAEAKNKAAPQPALSSATMDFATGANKLPAPSLLDLMTQHFLKNTPDHMKDMELQAIQTTNPALAASIKRRMRIIANAEKAIRALPEQKPPRSAKAGI